MPDEIKLFSELVKEAPLATEEDTVSLVGLLGRSAESGKFVLQLAPGNNITLDIDAVKGYRVLGASVGQTVVQVNVDRGKVPTAPFTVATAHQAPQNTLAALGAMANPAYVLGTTIRFFDAGGATLLRYDPQNPVEWPTGLPPNLD
jgi:hypothetical protein